MSTRPICTLSLAVALALNATAWATEFQTIPAQTAEQSTIGAFEIETPADVMTLPPDLRARLHDEALNGDPPRRSARSIRAATAGSAAGIEVVESGPCGDGGDSKSPRPLPASRSGIRLKSRT